jgi:hypothetical protein
MLLIIGKTEQDGPFYLNNWHVWDLEWKKIRNPTQQPTAEQIYSVALEVPDSLSNVMLRKLLLGLELWRQKEILPRFIKHPGNA